jgi:pyruvate-ferredoxin/flavodoxin oxidoreductase
MDTLHPQIVKELELIPEPELTSNRLLFKIKNNFNSLTVRSFWFLGGDGWAYDIEYGGIDHVLSRDANVTILVVDTEMYLKSGGQVSKSTQIGDSVKYSQSGKTSLKKDLGMKAMTYEHVYVASIALERITHKQCKPCLKLSLIQDHLLS